MVPRRCAGGLSGGVCLPALPRLREPLGHRLDVLDGAATGADAAPKVKPRLKTEADRPLGSRPLQSVRTVQARTVEQPAAPINSTTVTTWGSSMLPPMGPHGPLSGS